MGGLLQEYTENQDLFTLKHTFCANFSDLLWTVSKNQAVEFINLVELTAFNDE